MSYIQENLLPGEELLYKANVHWFVYSGALFCLVFSLLFLMYPVVALSIVFLGLAAFIKTFIYVKTTEFAVTSQRIIVKTGWISRTTVEQQLARIESVNFTQSITGRLLGYGTVLLHGTGSGVTPISGIDNPLEFHKHALMAIQQFAQRNI